MYMEDVLYRAIIKWYDDSFKEWKAIDNPDFVNYVCNEIGISKDEYNRIMRLEQ